MKSSEARPPLWPSKYQRRRRINAADLPHSCGMIFFYHIPCTGGSSIDASLLRGDRMQKHYNASHFTFWGRDPKTVTTKFHEGMDEHVRDIGPNEWRTARAHGLSIFLNESESRLDEWREAVEGGRHGCRWIMSTVLRGAMGHTVSQVKELHDRKMLACEKNESYDMTYDEWSSHLAETNQHMPSMWKTQLDYLLYNNGPRNGSTREEKVRRAVELLARHFDLVTIEDQDRYREAISQITGMEGLTIESTNIYDGEINFTQSELELLKRRTYENGDLDFIDAAKHMYGNYLDYLI